MPIRLATEQVNRFVAYKQYLTPSRRGTDVLTVAKQIGPIRADTAPTPYISLWARMSNLAPSAVDYQLYQSRNLVRIPCMHAQLHLVPSNELQAYQATFEPVLAEGLGDVLEDLMLNAPSSTFANRSGSRSLVQRILEVVNTSGPLTIAEMTRLLPELNASIDYNPDLPDLGSTRLAPRLIPALCVKGVLVRAEPRGGWLGNQYTYGSLAGWLPKITLGTMDAASALERIVRSYLAAYGPATIGDIAHWLGGIPRRQIAVAVMSLSKEVARIQISGSRGDFIMLESELDTLLEMGNLEPSAILLPGKDSYLTAYRDTTRFLPEYHRDRVYDRTSEPLGTVWWDGRVIGVWRMRRHAERISVRLFEIVDAHTLASIGEQARHLGQFMSYRSLDIEIGYDAEDDESEEVYAYVKLGD